MPPKGYKKPAREARAHRVHVRLTPQEKKHLADCVEASDVIGEADFVRSLIMGFDIKPRPPRTYAKLVDELARLNRKLASIDNNLNQIARSGHTTRIVSEIEFREDLEAHREVRELAATVLSRIAQRR